MRGILLPGQNLRQDRQLANEKRELLLMQGRTCMPKLWVVNGRAVCWQQRLFRSRIDELRQVILKGIHVLDPQTDLACFSVRQKLH